MEGSLSETIATFVKENLFVVILGMVGLMCLGYGLIASSVSSAAKDDIVFESTNSVTSGTKASPSPKKMIMVDVAGAVIKPGVYELEADSRVQDAIAQAGGMRDEADDLKVSQGMNLAAKLTDGAKLYIPFEGESITVDTGNMVLGESNSQLVNLNTATSSELESLPGVGPVTAEKIIANRPYASVDDLLKKKAVGKSIYEKIKDNVGL